MANDSSTLIPSHYVFSNTRNKPYVFCIPTSSGISTIYSGLSRASADFNVIGVNDPALSSPDLYGGSESQSFSDQAIKYYRQVLKIEAQLYPDMNQHDRRPMNVLGYSVGGNAALEVRYAMKAGRNVNPFVLDSSQNEMVKIIEQVGLERVNDHFPSTAPDALLKTAKARNKQNPRNYYEHDMEQYPEHITFFRTEGNITRGIEKQLASVDEVMLAGHRFGILKDQTAAVTQKVKQVILDQA